MSSTNSIFQSYSVLQTILLPSYTIPSVDDVEKENKPFFGYNTIGGVLFDTKFVWNANGPLFNLYNSKSGVKIASWNFGSIIKSTMTTVSCVVELYRGSGKLPFLIIGLQSETHGQICLLNISKPRILRCIKINERVTSLMVVDYKVPSLATYLKAFDGVLAVGTSGGNVYLVDINQLSCEEVLLESEADVRDEINPCQFEIVLFKEDLLKKSYPNTNHLAILLNAEKSDSKWFGLRGPDDDERIYVNKEEVEVSALHYCPQLGSLLVGFNFGAWQLWDLFNMKLAYTSPVYEEAIPVSHFGVQEPCDDPRAFCYIWTVYSNIEPNQPGYSGAVLYSLNYDKKEFVEGYGILYKNLISWCVRFRMDVTNCQNEIENSLIRAQCVSLQTVKKLVSRNSFGDYHDETVTVCSIVWNVWSSTFPKKFKTYLSLFDLNQWYKEQMPGSPNSKGCDTYLDYVCLTNILRVNNKLLPLLDVRINSDTLNQFMGTQRLEEHYHPSSLAFQMVVLEENCVSIIDNKGNQRALMTSLENLGPAVLLKPTEQFFLSVNFGLTPLFIDISNKMATTLEYQREVLLSVALEQKLLGWLCKCVSTWSSGVYENSGCSLNLLLSWGWQRAQVLKENADKLSVVLFDYSGLRLDANTHNLLSNCSQQLKDISTLFKFIVRKYLGFVLNPDIVKDQCESLEMASSHLEVVDWLLNIGLLPESPEYNYPRADECGCINAPFPIESLNEYYRNRRNELNSLGKKHFSSNDSLLFIDNLIDFEFGGCQLQKQWNVVSDCVGYPPQSLQALMRTYLVENVSLLNKHCVVAYLLLDISAALDQDRYKSIITHLLKFPSIFHLSPSITKIIQSLWQLDHGEFEAAVEQLLDPMISANDLKLWHHRIILKVLLSYEQYSLALAYLLERQPAVTEINDLCTILRLYIANNMIGEAFYFQRQNQSLDVASTLLERFYKECDKVDNLKSIIFLLLTKEEEDLFMKYLNDVKHPQANELKIYYYTQHSRYVNAMQIYDKTGTIQTGSRGLEGQHVLSDTDNIINKLTNVSNPLSRSIMDQLKKRDLNVLKVLNPQPFSVFVHNSDEHVKYKSSLIEAALVKAKETWNLNKTASNNIQDDIPFLCTPRTNLPTPRVLTPLIYPKSTSLYDEDGPSPAKRFKLMSRLSMSTAERKLDSEVTCRKLSVRLSTPVVKRKLIRTSERKIAPQINVETPQGILKSQIHNLAVSSENNYKHQTQYTSKDNTHSSFVISRKTSSTSRSSLSLTPRRSLLGNSRHAVRFSFTKPPSESSITSNSSDPDFEIIQENALVHSPLDGHDSIQNSTLDESLKDENVSFDPNKQQEELSEIAKSSVRSSLNFTSESPKTPRSRRSYRDLGEISVRSSPRLQKSKQIDDRSKEDDISIIELSSTCESFPKASITENTIELSKIPRSRRSYKDISHDDDEPEPQSLSKEILLPPRPKLQGRRSLTRKVLENNTLTRITEVRKASSTLEYSLNELVDVESKDDSLEIRITEHLESNLKSGDVTKPLETIIESKLVADSLQNLNEEIEVETLPEEVVFDFDPEEEQAKDTEEINYSIAEVVPVALPTDITKDTSAEGGKNSSDDADKVDVNIYDLSEDDYEAVDPKLSVFDVSNDLTLNEAICAVDNDSMVIETNSNYITDSGEVFGDKSDVLIALDEIVTETTVNNEHTNIEVPTLSESSVKHSSVSSDVEVIELSSSSDGENLNRSSSVDEDIYSSENESSINPTDSEESTSSTSNVSYNENILSSKDVLTEPCSVAPDCEKKKSREFSEHNLENVAIEEIEQNVEVSSVDISQNVVELKSVCEDKQVESNLQSSGIENITRKKEDNDEIDDTDTKVDSTSCKSSVVEESDETSTKEIENKEAVKTKSTSSVKDASNVVGSSDNNSYANIIDKDIFNESINITERINSFDLTVGAGISKNLFMASTPEGSIRNWNENECESDILDETVNRTINWSCDSDILSTPANQRKIIYHPDSQDRLNATPSRSTDYPKFVPDDIFLSKHTTPARRSQRISSLHTPNTSQTPDLRKYALRKRSLSTSHTNAGVDPLKLKQSLFKIGEKQAPSKRKRSSSTNAQSLVTPRSKRGASVDVELLSGKNQSSDTKKLVETSTSESTKKITSKKSKSAIISNETNLETYSSSRRLTRRQAELLKKTLGSDHIELNESNNSDERNRSPTRGPDIAQMDAIKLLDKKSFEGDPDPEEDLMNKSPVSSLAESPIGTRLRCKSSLSNASLCSETSPTPSESNKRKAKRILIDGCATSMIRQPSKSPDPQAKNKPVPRKIRKTRLNSKDTDVSDTSTISQARSLIEVKKPGKITRRTRSVTHETEQPLRRSERNILSKSNLPKIVEEHSETAHHSKKKTEKKAKK